MLNMRITQLLGFSIVSQGKAEVLSELKSHFQTGIKPWLLATPNPEQIMLSQQDEKFLRDLQHMDWLLPDGIGLVWASRVLNEKGQRVSDRITGLDLVPRLIEMAQNQNRPVLIVGGRNYQEKMIKFGQDEVVKQAAVENPNETFRQTKTRDKNQVVIRSTELWKSEQVGKKNIQEKFGVWWCEGYREVGAPTQEEDRWLGEVIDELKPVVVFVALGAPYQENWLVKRRAFLSAHHVLIGLTVGGAFDVLTGTLTRAPQFWQNSGLEWLWRLIQEPWRWRRQLALIKFVWLVVRTKMTPH